MSAPFHIKSLVPEQVRAALERDPQLLVPVSTCEQHGPHLPFGCDGTIVERLADDLSAACGILVAPTVAYGVNVRTRRPFPGNAAVRRKTLHRWMNDLIGDWEANGVDRFIILTANGHDPHQEALTTLRTLRARVFTVDVFALDFTGYLEEPTEAAQLDAWGFDQETSAFRVLVGESKRARDNGWHTTSAELDHMDGADEVRTVERGSSRIGETKPEDLMRAAWLRLPVRRRRG